MKSGSDKIVTRAENLLGAFAGPDVVDPALAGLAGLGVSVFDRADVERNIVSQFEEQLELYVDPLEKLILGKGLDKLVSGEGGNGTVSHITLKKMIRIFEVTVGKMLRKGEADTSLYSVSRVEELQIKIQLLKTILRQNEEQIEKERKEEILRKRRKQAERIELERKRALELQHKRQRRLEKALEAEEEEEEQLTRKPARKRKTIQLANPTDKPKPKLKKKISTNGKPLPTASPPKLKRGRSSTSSVKAEPGENTTACPICFRQFPVDVIEVHASRCGSNRRSAQPDLVPSSTILPNADNTNDDDDEAEFQASSSLSEDEGEEDEKRTTKSKARRSSTSSNPPKRKKARTGAKPRLGASVSSGTVVDDYLNDTYKGRIDETNLLDVLWGRRYKIAIADGMSEEEACEYANNRENAYDDDEQDIDLEEDEKEFVKLEKGFKVSRRIYSKLFDYQHDAIKWFLRLHINGTGGILGDEMGLGKTVQVCAFLAGLKSSGLLDPSIIACPATTIAQWVKELNKWAPRLRVLVLHSSGAALSVGNWSKAKLIKSAVKSGDVLLTTYHALRTNSDVLRSQGRWGYIILDEGHKIRNPEAEVTLACKRLHTVHRIILSGSPIQNNLRELWSLFDFVCPGKLGTLPIFDQHYSIPINTGGYSNATPNQVNVAYQCAKGLKETIEPHLLRRLKKDVATQLPQKTEQVIFCHLSKIQRDAYKDFLARPDVNDMVNSSADARSKKVTFKFIKSLQHICNHPEIYLQKLRASQDLTKRKVSSQVLNALNGLSDDEDAETLDVIDQRSIDNLVFQSGKMNVLRVLLRGWENQGHRVLLFSQGRLMLNILERFVKAERYSYLRMDGTTAIKSRQKLIDQFNDEESGVFVFLLTTKVGGLGINLMGANRVILYDPDWNPSTDNQARARAWRVGQTREVTIYRLITKGTIEEKMYHRQIFKGYLSGKVLVNPKQARFSKVSNMRDLFSLDEGSADDRWEMNEVQRKLRANAMMKKRTKLSKKLLQEAEREPTQEEVRASQKVAQKLAADVVEFPDTETSDLLGKGKVNLHNEKSENRNILQALFESGSAGYQAFDHSTVEKSASSTADSRLVALKAKQQAKIISEALKQERAAHNNSSSSNSSSSSHQGRFGGTQSAGLLAELRQRNISDEVNESQVSALVSSTDNAEMNLIRKLRDFLHEKPHTSKDILDEFSLEGIMSPPDFRECLREISSLQDGQWVLKPEFS